MDGCTDMAMSFELSDKYVTFLRKDHLLPFKNPLPMNQRLATIFTVFEVTKFLGFTTYIRKIESILFASTLTPTFFQTMRKPSFLLWAFVPQS